LSIEKVGSLDCPDEFNQRNFALVEHTDKKGEARPMYEMTRDGWALSENCSQNEVIRIKYNLQKPKENKSGVKKGRDNKCLKKQEKWGVVK